MAIGYRQMLEEAEAEVRSVSTEEGALLRAQAEVVFIDIRDPREWAREGMIPGAHRAPRGMLEFWIDPESPYHKPYFAEDKLSVFYCASGWRSAAGGAGGAAHGAALRQPDRRLRRLAPRRPGGGGAGGPLRPRFARR